MSKLSDDHKDRHGIGARYEKTPTMPHNLGAEVALIGAVLFSNPVYDRVAGYVRPQDFYAPAHQKLWSTVSAMITRGQAADGVTLREHFELSGQFESVGGAKYLYDLLEAAAFGPEVVDYAKMIADLSVRRRIVEAGIAAQALGLEPPDNVSSVSLVAQAQDMLADAAGKSAIKWLPADASAKGSLDAIRERQRLGSVAGLQIGIDGFDRASGGLHGGDLIVLAGRPSMGKTAIARALAYGAASTPQILIEPEDTDPYKVGARVAFFSQEMTREQIDWRAMSAQARSDGIGYVEYQSLRRGALTPQQFDILTSAAERLPKTISVDATSSLTVADIATRCRAFERAMGGIDMIVIDYLQIMEIAVGMGMNLASAIGQTTAGLKALAKRLGVPLIVLSQLSRGVEQRDNKRPVMSDLRESGAIEQDADTVIFVYRDEYYLERAQPDLDRKGVIGEHAEWERRMAASKGKVDLIFAKQRMGPVTTVTLNFEKETDYVGDGPPPPRPGEQGGFEL